MSFTSLVATSLMGVCLVSVLWPNTEVTIVGICETEHEMAKMREKSISRELNRFLHCLPFPCP